MNHPIINEKLAKAKAECEWLESLCENWNNSLDIVKKTYNDISLQDGDLAEKYRQEVMACVNFSDLEIAEKVNISTTALPDISKEPIETKNNVIPLEINSSTKAKEESGKKPNNETTLPPLDQQLGSVSDIKFNAAIGLDTVTSKAMGKIVNEYPIKIEGKIYASAWEAVSDGLTDDYIESMDDSNDHQLMKSIVLAKLEQYPNFVKALTKSGGVSWLRGCSYFENNPVIDEYWQGVGMDSGFIRALIAAYQEKTQKEISTETNIETNNGIEPEYLSLSENLFYEPLGKIMKVTFSNFQLARKWGKYLKENFACESYSLETLETVVNSEYSRILKAEQVTSETVDYLVECANFKQEPGENNPLNLVSEYA